MNSNSAESNQNQNSTPLEGGSTSPISTSFLNGDMFRISLLLSTLAFDQITKFLARTHLGLPNGEPDYYKFKQVFGEWLQFRLVYNSGAAFGMKPQSFLPFLNPTVFYAVFSCIAIGVLIGYYRKLNAADLWPKLGVTLILSGAFGNLIDRLAFQKVTDFIEVGIPGIQPHWPNFNIADSCVCIGVGLILLAPFLSGLSKKTTQQTIPAPSASSAES